VIFAIGPAEIQWIVVSDHCGYFLDEEVSLTAETQGGFHPEVNEVFVYGLADVLSEQAIEVSGGHSSHIAQILNGYWTVDVVVDELSYPLQHVSVSLPWGLRRIFIRGLARSALLQFPEDSQKFNADAIQDLSVQFRRSLLGFGRKWL